MAIMTIPFRLLVTFILMKAGAGVAFFLVFSGILNVLLAGVNFPFQFPITPDLGFATIGGVFVGYLQFMITTRQF